MQIPPGLLRNIEFSEANMEQLQDLMKPAKPPVDTEKIDPAAQQQMDEEDGKREKMMQAKVDDDDEREAEENARDWEGMDKDAWMAAKYPALANPATVPAATVPDATVLPATVPPPTVPPLTVPPPTVPPGAAKIDPVKSLADKIADTNKASPSTTSSSCQTKRLVTKNAIAQTDAAVELAVAQEAITKLHQEFAIQEGQCAEKAIALAQKRKENDELQGAIVQAQNTQKELQDTIAKMKEKEGKDKEAIGKLQESAKRNYAVLSELESAQQMHDVNYRKHQLALATSEKNASDMKKRLDEAKKLERDLYKLEERTSLWKAIRSELGGVRI